MYDYWNEAMKAASQIVGKEKHYAREGEPSYAEKREIAVIVMAKMKEAVEITRAAPCESSHHVQSGPCKFCLEHHQRRSLMITQQFMGDPAGFVCVSSEGVKIVRGPK